MDDDDFIDFNNTPPKININNSPKRCPSSPGTNPFDRLLLEAEFNRSDSSFRRESLLFSGDDIPDVGKESLGILQLESLDISFGLNSHNVLNVNLGKEDNFLQKFKKLSSNLNHNFLESVLDRKSLSSCPPVDNIHSLCSVNLNPNESSKMHSLRSSNPFNTAFINSRNVGSFYATELVYNENSKILVQNKKDLSNNILCALPQLLSIPGRKSIISSSSTYNSSQSFHSTSLRPSEASRIYSHNSLSLTELKPDILDIAFISDADSIVSNKTDAASSFRARLASLPEPLHTTKTTVSNECSDILSVSNTRRSITMEDVKQDTCKWLQASNFNHSLMSAADSDPLDNTVNDLAFIEASHLASKIADGSILDEPVEGDDLLDSIIEPAWDEIQEEEKNAKVDIDTVFKTIDRLLPTSDTLKGYDEVADSASPVMNNPNENHQLQLLTSHASNISNSKDPKELLRNLSEILSHDARDIQEMQKGQNLLHSLAEMLSSNRSKSKDDSIQSSVEANQESQQVDPRLHERYEVLNLRKRTNVSEENLPILDISLNTKVHDTPRRSASFSASSSKVVSKLLESSKISFKSFASSSDSNQNRSGRLRSSGSSIDSRNISVASQNSSRSSIITKLKYKKNDGKGILSQKGPLKAVLPIGSMAKRKSLSGSGAPVNKTPTKSSYSQSISNVKKTSTPIAEPRLKPVAQSTPDGSRVNLEESLSEGRSNLPRRKSDHHNSLLTRPNNSSNMSIDSVDSDVCKSSRSDSAPDLSRSSALQRTSLIPSLNSISRRHSSTDIKSANKFAMKRSYSTGKGIGNSLVDKVKENITTASRKISTKVENFKQSVSLNHSFKYKSVQNYNKSGPKDKNGEHSISMKSSNLLKKKIGKENCNP